MEDLEYQSVATVHLAGLAWAWIDMSPKLGADDLLGFVSPSIE
jgi:hypothetical protein